MPVCKICNETKPDDAFNRNRTKANGRHSYCRECSRVRVRELQRKLRADPQYRRTEWARRKELRTMGEDPIGDLLKRFDARRQANQ